MDGIQLFILPFAGGNSSSFDDMNSLVNAGIDPITVEYSGRLSRRKDGYILKYEEFLFDVVRFITKRRNGNPWALLGYSLGSVLTYDIARRALVDDMLQHAFICARGDLNSASISQGYAGLKDEEFTRKIVELGGFDERLLNDKRFLKIYMEPVQNDYAVWSDYVFCDDGRKIHCDATVIYSEKDPLCANIRAWDGLCDGIIDYYEMGENHFFIRDHYAEMAEIINSKLRRA